MLLEEQMYPFNVQGITDIEIVDNAGNINFALSVESDNNTIKNLINDIPNQKTIMFFDKNHPSPSDPGAFVRFMRIDNQYIMQRFNTGWSNKWKYVSGEELEQYLQMCSDTHTTGKQNLIAIRLDSVTNTPSKDQIDSQGIVNGEGKNAKFLKIFLTALFILLFVWLYLAYYR